MKTDSQLIREIKDGNVECYSELIDRYERKIYSFISHMLRNYKMEALAEDLCQETFYKAFRSLKTFRDVEASFSTWLYTIARNCVLTELRKCRNKEVYLEDSYATPKVAVEKLPEQQILQNEREQLVRKAINNLPEKQRSALILREYEQMDYKDIANLLDSTVSSVKSLLFRARSSVRSQLESYIQEPLLEKVEGMNK
ncbi:sigma-70 family RNA polymerase sigma factor [Microaerobacter geothermalis]|uniref:RNA polymerase sigma factor n=1 Tax=Microaerobacter geothermalis TaxID=674972 RepID=UPI001F245576|nr:sigma-70 family RNA polymerase sigma factor [Microaerobacter geothermalis]MCF6093370.1 sigma-70 family RNA polymerase sigma factor [Microaerobacter geothermalis]